jgi:hypothetical protein
LKVRRTGPTLILKKSYRGIGRIRRSSGTRSQGILLDIMASLDAIYEDGRLDVLEMVRDGEIRPIDVFRFKVEQVPSIERRKQYVYVIRATHSGNVKIGIAVDPTARLLDLQCSNWEELEIVATIRGSREDERKIHRRFAEHRIAREWFRPAPEVLAWIEDLCREDPP